MPNQRISVLCVDDNEDLCRALGSRLRDEGFDWCGYLTRADNLLTHVDAACPEVDVVLLDADMPGKDPFTAAADLAERRPEVKTLVFSGHVRRDLMDRAVEAGVWGYVSKGDGEEALIRAIHAVVQGEFALSDQAAMELG